MTVKDHHEGKKSHHSQIKNDRSGRKALNVKCRQALITLEILVPSKFRNPNG
jgi:hypothetical protein